MSFVTTQPELLGAAAGTLQGIGSAMTAGNARCGGTHHRSHSRGRR